MTARGVVETAPVTRPGANLFGEVDDREESHTASMDRSTELHELCDAIADHDGVLDAWTAKSFTDRLVVVDVRADGEFPDEITRRLRENGLSGYNEVYEGDAERPSFAGSLADCDRYQFVDLESRGDLQSYVVE